MLQKCGDDRSIAATESSQNLPCELAVIHGNDVGNLSQCCGNLAGPADDRRFVVIDRRLDAKVLHLVIQPDI